MGQFENKDSFAPDRLITLASALAILDTAMSQISPSDAEALLGKLLTERIPLHAHFRSPSRVEARISGFVDSKTVANGLVISSSGPPIDVDRGYLRIFFSDAWSCWYGEKRELPPEMQPLADKFGESALILKSLESNEQLVIFFTL